MTSDFDIRRIEVIDDATADMYRRMSPARRLEIGFRSYWFARDLLHAAVKQGHPDWSPQAIEAEVLRRLLAAA